MADAGEGDAATKWAVKRLEVLSTLVPYRFLKHVLDARPTAYQKVHLG